MNIIKRYYAIAGISYVVVEKNNEYYQVFKMEEHNNKETKYFITHKDSLKSAKKLAKLLANTYSDGFAHGSY